MSLDHGVLARIDARIFRELGRAARPQMVKVPVSDAVWSTWRRYCEAVGVTLGEGVAALITHELRTVVEESDGGTVFGDRVNRRAAELDARERKLDARAVHLQRKEQHLRRQQPLRPAGAPAAQVKVGRNKRCPCGSGLKHKHCCGLSGR